MMVPRLFAIIPVEQTQPKLKYIQELHDDLYRELNRTMYENIRDNKSIDIYV